MFVKTEIARREIPIDLYLFIDKLVELRKEKKTWDALDEIVKYYKKQYPEEYKDTVSISHGLRGTRGDEWGRGAKYLHEDSRRANFRMVMNLPYRLITVIRKLYNVEELPFDRAFLREFGSRNPEFLVPEKGNKTWSRRK